jgi:hypothetical protein
LTFSAFQKNLPATPVHDLVVHPRESELILGTHGRSILIASVKEIQQATPEILASALHLFELPKSKAQRWGYAWSKFAKIETPNLAIPIFTTQNATAKISIFSDKGLLINAFDAPLTKGFNYPEYHYTLTENMVADYEKELNEAAKAKEKDATAKIKPIKIKKADDNNYYIKAGTYKIVVEMGDKKVEGKLELE